MATGVWLVKPNWGYGVTSNDENCLVLRQSPDVNELGGSGPCSPGKF